MTKLTESDLAQFSGTDNWYEHQSRMLYTDGVKFMAERGGAYWLIDAIASYQRDRRIRTNHMLLEFQLWELKVKDNKATLTLRTDTGEPATITQRIPYTDFPLESIKLYVENNTLLLPSEH